MLRQGGSRLRHLCLLPARRSCVGNLEWLGPFASLTHSAADNGLYDSVVKIDSTSLRPNYFQPWQLKGQSDSSGSGFAISGNVILTNAHVVADNAFATVRRHGSSERFKCSVHAIAHECDLALLAVQDERFWREPSPMKPLNLGDIPELQDDVIVVGYPQGGSNICVTQGVVSRVGMTSYAHTGTKLLAVQIDAAINPGNSGGPALQDGRVVGMAFQDLEGGENVGYIIPSPIIKHFLAEVEREGEYRGICSLGMRCQALESPAARRALGMGEGQTGVLVIQVVPDGPASSTVLPGDVLLCFDHTSIANDGSFLFRQRERISFDHLVTLKVPGDVATLRLLRQGQEVECVVRPRPLPCPVPLHQFEQPPSYYIYGGLVFQPLSQPYLQEWGEEGEAWQDKCPQNLRDLMTKAQQRQQQHEGGDPVSQVVILSQVLADDVNFGYGRLEDLQLLEVDGVRVRDMRHLAALLCPAQCGGGVSHQGGAVASSNGGEGDVEADASSRSSSNHSDAQVGDAPGMQRQQQGAQHAQQEQQHEQTEEVWQSQHDASVRRAEGEEGRSRTGPSEALHLQPVAVQAQPGAAYARVGGGRYVRFMLERNQVVILDRQEAQDALHRILDTHKIPSHCSSDLLQAVDGAV